MRGHFRYTEDKLYFSEQKKCASEKRRQHSAAPLMDPCLVMPSELKDSSSMAIISSLFGSALSSQSSICSSCAAAIHSAMTTDGVCPRFILWASLLDWAEQIPIGPRDPPACLRRLGSGRSIPIGRLL